MARMQMPQRGRRLRAAPEVALVLAMTIASFARKRGTLDASRGV